MECTKASGNCYQYASSHNVFEIDGVVFDGMTKSAGLIIKTEAKKLAKSVATFKDLTSQKKNSVFLGFNYILFLSNNSTEQDPQRSFFTSTNGKQL